MIEDVPAAIAGFWDYGVETPTGVMSMVVVDQDGAGRVECATEAGDQLRHLGCPLAGPCAA